MMARITKAEKERRVTKVAEMLLQGVSRAQILQNASNLWGKLTDRAIDNYIAAATDTIKESAETDRDLEIAKTKERLEYLFAVNMGNKDYREARNVLKDRAGLLGIEAPKKLESTGEIVIRYEDDNDDNAP